MMTPVVRRQLIWTQALTLIASISIGLIALGYVRHADDMRQREDQRQVAERQKADAEQIAARQEQFCTLVIELRDTYRELEQTSTNPGNAAKLTEVWDGIRAFMGCPDR